MESNQVNTALRYLGSAGATAFTIMGALAIIPADSSKELITQLHILGDSLGTAYGALTKMWVILGPVAFIWLTKMGVNSSSVKGLLGKLTTIAQSSNPVTASQAQAGIVNANAQVLKTAPGANTEVKAAILDAAASLPETQGTIVVNDARLAMAVPNSKVVSQ